MKIARIALAAAALATAAGALAASNETNAKGEAKIAKLIAGRTAGTPVSCIPAVFNGQNMQVIDSTAIVYDAGSTIYVARPDDPKSLDSDNILIIDRFGSQICKQDVIRTVDRYSGFMTGAVFLGDFTPYKK
ncbi:MAG: hypothetical protein J7498_01035 [Sphingobium sp.]|nr:hypothetical protein [Sphingobium sp.]